LDCFTFTFNFLCQSGTKQRQNTPYISYVINYVDDDDDDDEEEDDDCNNFIFP